MQIRAAAVPSQRVSLWHRLPVAAGRGERLASRYHNQTDPARHPGPAQRAKYQGSCASRGLHNLLVIIPSPGGRETSIVLTICLFLQPEPIRIREAGASTGTSHVRHRIRVLF